MRKIVWIATLFLLSALLPACYSYYDHGKNYIATQPKGFNELKPNSFKDWGLREVNVMGYEYNTDATFSKAYVIYYFDTLNKKNNIGLYYESDAFFLKDLVKLFEEYNYTNPLNSNWRVPFYCSAYYFKNDLINLCTPHEWGKKKDLYERKVFDIDTNENSITKLYEYKFDNPDALYSNSYKINLYDKDELTDWIEEQKNTAVLRAGEEKYTDAFYGYIDTSQFKKDVKEGWVYFGEDTGKVSFWNKYFPKDYLKYNFFYQNWLYVGKFKSKCRFPLPKPVLIYKYPIFHPKNLCRRSLRLIPIYDLPVHDTVSSDSGKGKIIINEVTNHYSYRVIDATIVYNIKNPGVKYIWVKVSLEKMLGEQQEQIMLQRKQLIKQQKKLQRKKTRG